MHVSSVLGKKPADIIWVLPEDTVLDVVKTFSTNKIGFVVVGDPAHNIKGTVSERDICHELAMGAHRDTVVKDIMTDHIEKCCLEDNLAKATAIMTERRTRHLLVYDGDKLKGLISIGDVIKHRLDETLQYEEELRHYIEGTGYSYSPPHNVINSDKDV